MLLRIQPMRLKSPPPPPLPLPRLPLRPPLRMMQARALGSSRRSAQLVSGVSGHAHAPGLRAVRYFKELPGQNQIIANDFSADAVESIRRNVEYNGLSTSTEVIPSHADAGWVICMGC